MSNINYNKLPSLIPDEIIERASKLSTAQICDGMKELCIFKNGCMDSNIMPVDENMRILGTACTISTDNGDNLPLHVAIYQGQPGYVLVVDGKGHTEHAYMGDLMASAAKAVGLNGVVVDGLVRDRVNLKELGLPIFSKGFVQNGPIKKDPGEMNTTIKCAGIIVEPGDLVVGDYDGVTVVPRNQIEVVLENAEKKFKYEEDRREIIDEYIKCTVEGRDTPDITPDWVKEMKEKLGL